MAAFRFAIDEPRIRAKLGRISILPFAGYSSGSYLSAFSDLLTKISLSLAMGATAAVVYPRHAASGIVKVACLAAAAVFFAAIEAGQLFLPTRAPDPTDVLVGVAGVHAGMLLGRWARADRETDRHS